MTWVLLITVLVNGQVLHPDKATFKTKADCMEVLKVVEQHPLFKQYGGKAVCEATR
jgi:hypothetical protein